MNPVERARIRAQRLYPKSSQFQDAYVAGARAALDGRTSKACPYNVRLGDGSWRRAWRNAWMRGHASCASIPEP